MTATDLMIGDWVQNQNGSIKGRIVSIDAYQNRVEFGAHTIDADFVYPISLTSEILEKNGFAKVFLERAYNLPDYRSDIWFSQSTDYFYFGFDDTAAQFNCQYVHELQHALKLCGIDKEIVL